MIFLSVSSCPCWRSDFKRGFSEIAAPSQYEHAGGTDELPAVDVFVSAFYMEKYEVTKAQWDQVKAWGPQRLRL